MVKNTPLQSVGGVREGVVGTVKNTPLQSVRGVRKGVVDTVM